MKTLNYLLIIIFLAASLMANAQHTVKLQGTSNEFMKRFEKNSGSRLTKKEAGIKLPDGRLLTVSIDCETHSANSKTYQGNIKDQNSFFHLRTLSTRKIEGQIILKDTKQAYKLYSDSKDNVYAKEVSMNEVICSEYLEPSAQPAVSSTAVPAGQSVYELQSYPLATCVVLLDFDGQYVPAGYWGNAINALPAMLSDDEKYEAWQLISEDYRPFKLNITTSERVYQQAPANRRMRVIFTPTTDAYPGVGGISFIGSFTWGNDTPCWVFNSTAKYAGEAGSHELGHTFGLFHDGLNDGINRQEYYYGTGYWAPIMGVGYYANLVQWSKGEYNFASNHEDDVAIIAGSSNGFGYRDDLIGNTNATAKPLLLDCTGNVSSSVNYGVVENALDADVFSFTTSGGTVYLQVSPVTSSPDLDIQLIIKDSTNTVKATLDGQGLYTIINLSFTPGTYYVYVKGVGSGDPTTTGYSNYGSNGYYSINGLIPVTNSLLVADHPTDLTNGLTYSYYEGSWNNLPDFSSQPTLKTGTVSTFDLSPKNSNVNYAFTYKGYVSVPSDGVYTFYTSSDAGSRLMIGNTLVVNNDGLHAVQEGSGTIGLKAGVHAIEVNYFEEVDAGSLYVSYSNAGISKRIIPSSALFRVGTVEELSGYYEILAKNSGKSLDVSAVSMDNGALIQQWDYAGSENQQWLIESVGDGYYKILSKHSGKGLDVSGVSMANGALIQQWDYAGSENQKWKIENVDEDYYKISAKHSGKSLDVSAVSMDNGALIQQWDYAGNDNQKWKLLFLGSTSNNLSASRNVVSVAQASLEPVADKEDLEKISLYPNPVRGQLKITVHSLESGMANIQIINDFSTQLNQDFALQTGSNNVELDMTTLPNGLYFLKLSKDQKIKYKKLIIER